MNIIKFSYSFLFIAYIICYLNIEGVQVIKWFSIIVLFISLLVGLKNGDNKGFLISPASLIFLFLFNILGFLTTVTSKEYFASLITLLGLDMYFIIYYINSYSISLSIKKLIRFNNLLIIISTLITILALLINPALTISQFSTYFYERIRIYGIFQHPNYFGAVCFVTLIALFININLTQEKRRRNLFLFILFILLLILSDSRGGLYSFLIFLLIYYVNIFLSNFSNVVRMIILFITVTIVILIVPFILGNIDSLMDDQKLNTFTSGRIENWSVILTNLLKDKTHYFLGYGLSSGGAGALFNIGTTTDNGYLIWIFQAGIISLSLVFLLLINIYIKNKKNKELSLFTIPLFISYLIYSFFENFLMSFGHIVPFYCWTICFIAFHAKSSYLKR